MINFVSWWIAVAVVMAVIIGMFRLISGKEKAKTVAVFFAGWVVGAIAMYIKAKLVYKF